MFNPNSIRPAREFVKRYGVKALVYGQAGTNKTPAVKTAPRPLLVAMEPGLRSMKGSDVPTVVVDTVPLIDDFFKWWHQSAGAKPYDTLFIDSGSQYAELVLAHKLAKIKHGMKAYGEMAEQVLEDFTKLYHMPEKHVICICKQTQVEIGTEAVMKDGQFVIEKVYQSGPYFPGKELNVKVPHQYDCIWQAFWFDVNGKRESAVKTVGNSDVYARTRGGLEAGINEVEPLNYTYLFDKLMK